MWIVPKWGKFQRINYQWRVKLKARVLPEDSSSDTEEEHFEEISLGQSQPKWKISEDGSVHHKVSVLNKSGQSKAKHKLPKDSDSESKNNMKIRSGWSKAKYKIPEDSNSESNTIAKITSSRTKAKCKLLEDSDTEPTCKKKKDMSEMKELVSREKVSEAIPSSKTVNIPVDDLNSLLDFVR